MPILDAACVKGKRPPIPRFFSVLKLPLAEWIWRTAAILLDDDAQLCLTLAWPPPTLRCWWPRVPIRLPSSSVSCSSFFCEIAHTTLNSLIPSLLASAGLFYLVCGHERVWLKGTWQWGGFPGVFAEIDSSWLPDSPSQKVGFWMFKRKLGESGSRHGESESRYSNF